MNRKEAHKSLFEKIGQLFPGFKRRPQGRFEQKFSEGTRTVYVGFWAYAPQCVFSLSPAVRIDAIEQYLCEMHGAKIPCETDTIAIQLWKLDGLTERPLNYVPLPQFAGHYFWVFHDEASLSAICVELQTRLQVVFEFFERFQTIEQIDQGINVEGIDVTMGSPRHGILTRYHLRGDWKSLATSYLDRALDADKVFLEMLIQYLDTRMGYLDDKSN